MGKQEIEQYWDEHWKLVVSDPEQELHSQSIPNDFRKEIVKHPITFSVILNAKQILDVACGTGHLLYTLSKFSFANFLKGVDISKVIIDYAAKKYSNETIFFSYGNIIKDSIHAEDAESRYYGDNGEELLIVCSNTLEHFDDPYPMIDKLVKNCKYLLILVPNEGTDTDGNWGCGGPGHVYSFNIDSFKEYEVIDSWVFKTAGWTEGENPLQLCVLLKGKL